MATEKNQIPKNDGTESLNEGIAELQAVFDEASEKGYFGEVPDEKPNEAYTVAGVVKAAKDKEGGK